MLSPIGYALKWSAKTEHTTTAQSIVLNAVSLFLNGDCVTSANTRKKHRLVYGRVERVLASDIKLTLNEVVWGMYDTLLFSVKQIMKV